MTLTFSGISKSRSTGKSARMKTKRLVSLLLALLFMLLCGCGKTPADSPKTGPVPSESEEFVFSGETLPLIAAQTGFCANGNLYFIQKGWLRYTALKTGRTQILCFDPLCSHDEITSEVTCPALSRMSDLESRVLVRGGKVWFTAKTMAAQAGEPEYVQIRSLDLETMELDVYLKNNENPILDFWFYGDELYLSMPTVREQENGGILYAGGQIWRLEKNSRLTLLVNDPEDAQFQLLASGSGCLYYGSKWGDGTIYQASPDFSHTKTAAVLGNVRGVEIHGEYVYYQKPTGNRQTAECPLMEGDFDVESSITRGGAEEAQLCRMKLDGRGEEETVHSSMPMPMNNAAISYRNYIFDDGGLLWLTPLDAVCTGWRVWQPNASMIRMGASGKDILTGFFSTTNGRVIALDPDTGKTVKEYRDLGVDILDFYSVENGQIFGYFAATDPSVLDEKGTGSTMTYRYSGVLPLE